MQDLQQIIKVCRIHRLIIDHFFFSHHISTGQSDDAVKAVVQDRFCHADIPSRAEKNLVSLLTGFFNRS